MSVVRLEAFVAIFLQDLERHRQPGRRRTGRHPRTQGLSKSPHLYILFGNPWVKEPRCLVGSVC